MRSTKRDAFTVAILTGGLLIAAGISAAQTAAQERVPAQPMSFWGADWLERAERDDEERPDIVLDGRVVIELKAVARARR